MRFVEGGAKQSNINSLLHCTIHVKGDRTEYLFYISFERAKSTNYDDVIATIPSLLQAELQGIEVSQKMEKGRVGVVFSCHKIKR